MYLHKYILHLQKYFTSDDEEHAILLTIILCCVWGAYFNNLEEMMANVDINIIARENVCRP